MGLLERLQNGNATIEDQRRAAAHLRQLRAAMEKVNGWLVCSAIATNDDMAKSFPEMEKLTRLEPFE